MLSYTRRLLACMLLFAVALALGACGDDGGGADGGGGGDGGDVDAGDGSTDSGPTPMPDAGPMIVAQATCDAPKVVMGAIGDVTVMGDTTFGPSGPLDLGPDCNNQRAMRRAAQDVIEYHVPGTGPVAVDFTTVNAGTPTTFDSLVQVRTGSCDAVPDRGVVPTCFDDASRGEYRTTGTVGAMGGDTVYLIVTGYSETPIDRSSDGGPYRMVISARENNLPEVTGGEVRTIADRAEVEISGTDADGDAVGFVAHFVDDMGAAVAMDFDGDGTLDGNQFSGRFDADLSGMTSFTGLAIVDQLGVAIRFGTPSAATQAEVQVFDAGFGIGPATTVPVRDLIAAGLGDMCDGGVTSECATTLLCDMGTCVATPEIATACGAATPLSVPTPTTTTTTASVTGTITTGDGLFTGGCGNTPGPEQIYTVDVPMGAFDLIVDTDQPGTDMTDTVLYVRSTCEVPITEVACNDDVAMDTLSSNVEIRDAAAGTYAIFVEQYGAATTSGGFEMQVSLRPVLPSGAACDATGAGSRCAMGACSGGACP